MGVCKCMRVCVRHILDYFSRGVCSTVASDWFHELRTQTDPKKLGVITYVFALAICFMVHREGPTLFGQFGNSTRCLPSYIAQLWLGSGATVRVCK